MTATKVKPNETIGDDLPILTFQVNRIMKNCQYQVDTKNEWVQWITADVNRTSLKSITQAQAIKIIRQQTGKTKPETQENWGYFDKNNKQHSYIRSLLYQSDIIVISEKWGEVADMEGWFTKFLKSKRSPVQKPLKEMNTNETSKIITALEGVAVWKNSI